MKKVLLSLFMLSGMSSVSPGAEPFSSGLQPGQRPGPYSFLVATGQERGQQTCYVCETAERPAVIVFSRSLNDPFAQLLVACDRWLVAQPKNSARAWCTILGEKTVSLDDLAKWVQKNGIKSMPAGVFDDPLGPPAYKLHEQADVTILIYTNNKVVKNFAFRSGELNNESIKQVTEQLKNLGQKK